MRRWIAAITVLATLSAPLAAEASPWGWVEHHAKSVEQGVVGVAAVAAGFAGYALAGNAVLGALTAAEIAGGSLALTLGIAAVTPILAGGLIALGGYEIYEAVEGTDVHRNAETRFLPQDRPSAPETRNFGMHH